MPKSATEADDKSSPVKQPTVSDSNEDPQDPSASDEGTLKRPRPEVDDEPVKKLREEPSKEGKESSPAEGEAEKGEAEKAAAGGSGESAKSPMVAKPDAGLQPGAAPGLLPQQQFAQQQMNAAQARAFMGAGQVFPPGQLPLAFAAAPPGAFATGANGPPLDVEAIVREHRARAEQQGTPAQGLPAQQQQQPDANLLQSYARQGFPFGGAMPPNAMHNAATLHHMMLAQQHAVASGNPNGAGMADLNALRMLNAGMAPGGFNPSGYLLGGHPMGGGFMRNPLMRAPSNSIGLGLSCDNDNLSEYQILVRKQLELFEAQPEDVESNTQGRKKQLVLGQVGLRCRHCAHLPLRNRGKGAVYYPAKLQGVYQAAQNMASSHLCEACTVIEDPLKMELKKLRERRDTASGGKQYWADGARVLGLYETEDGIRLRRPGSDSAPSGSSNV